MNESILDQLEDQMEAMRQLRRKEQKKENAEQQKMTDQKYRTLVWQANQYMEVLNYIQDYLGFVCSAELTAGLKSLFQKLESSTCYGDAEKESVSQAEEMFKNIQAGTKREWTKYFDGLTKKTKGTLGIIREIDSKKVDDCLRMIQNAAGWTIEKAVFEQLRQALNGAEVLIQGLSLDSDIKEFLSKMSRGQATMEDLNEDIMEWIRNGKFESRIRLSFR